jgi:metal-sulfur cluster biosynthetic enzyme
MDIVDLGLLYDVEIDGPKVKVIHSLTSMGCPAGPMIQEDIVNVASAVEGVEEVEIELTWEPPWTPDRMSDDAKFILGFG